MKEIILGILFLMMMALVILCYAGIVFKLPFPKFWTKERENKNTKDNNDSDILDSLPDDLLTPEQLAERKIRQNRENHRTSVQEWIVTESGSIYDPEPKDIPTIKTPKPDTPEIITLKAKIKGQKAYIQKFPKEYEENISLGYDCLAQRDLKLFKIYSDELPKNEEKLASLTKVAPAFHPDKYF